MRKAFYCEEMNFAGQFVPVIYYDELPTKANRSNGKESIRQRRNVHDISELVEGDEFQGSILALQKLYNTPSPIPKKEKLMARPVSGYLSASGQFYDTQAEAEFHDASSELYEAMRKIVFDKLAPTSSESATEIVDYMIAEIYNNKELIKEYIKTKEILKNEQLRESLEADTENPPETPSEGA